LTGPPGRLDCLKGIFGEVARGLMAEALTNPDRNADLRSNTFTTRDRLMPETLDRAAARGDIPPAAITPQLVGSAPALVEHHFLIDDANVPDDVLTGIVDNVLLPCSPPLASPAPPTRTPRPSQP
jgi:hypothetical protein